jgi:hypothetical protein
MDDYQQRVIAEKQDLDEKKKKLGIFLQGRNTAYRDLSPQDQRLLERQYDAMNEYSGILRERIARFTKTENQP